MCSHYVPMSLPVHANARHQRPGELGPQPAGWTNPAHARPDGPCHPNCQHGRAGQSGFKLPPGLRGRKKESAGSVENFPAGTRRGLALGRADLRATMHCFCPHLAAFPLIFKFGVFGGRLLWLSPQFKFQVGIMAMEGGREGRPAFLPPPHPTKP